MLPEWRRLNLELAAAVRAVFQVDLKHPLEQTNVKDSIAAAMAPTGGDADTGRGRQAQGMEWPEPEPLTGPLDAQPYPDEALPRILRDAVRQAQAFVQAPMALVACSALSTLSLAAQGLANVRLDSQLVGPISPYLLAVADSGERKTTCDAIFSPALRDWEAGQRQEMSPALLFDRA
jgi:hypothetical protein